jgi:SPP1 family predicted phage head-tail adaptor
MGFNNAPGGTGELNTVILAQKPVMSSDSQGGQLTEWVNDFEFYASVTWYRGDERMIADKLVSITTAQIACRWDPRLTSSHRLVIQQQFQGVVSKQVLNIRVVTNYLQRNQWMNVRAEVGLGS